MYISSAAEMSTQADIDPSDMVVSPDLIIFPKSNYHLLLLSSEIGLFDRCLLIYYVHAFSIGYCLGHCLLIFIISWSCHTVLQKIPLFSAISFYLCPQDVYL